MHEPHWIITAIIGAMLGLLPDIIKISHNIIKRFKKNRLTGDWYVYEFTRTNVVIKSTSGVCTIKNGLLSIYNIHMKNDRLVYKGTADVEDNHLYMKIKNTNDSSVRKETCWQRYDFSYDNYDLIYGLWVSNDYDGHTACGVSVLSKDTLNDSDLNNILLNKYISQPNTFIAIK